MPFTLDNELLQLFLSLHYRVRVLKNLRLIGHHRTTLFFWLVLRDLLVAGVELGDLVFGVPFLALAKLVPRHGPFGHTVLLLSLHKRVGSLQVLCTLLFFSQLCLFHAFVVDAGLAGFEVQFQLQVIKVLHHLVVKWVICGFPGHDEVIRVFGSGWGGHFDDRGARGHLNWLVFQVVIRIAGAVGDHDWIGGLVMMLSSERATTLSWLVRLIVITARRVHGWFRLGLFCTQSLAQSFRPAGCRCRYHYVQVE